MAICIRCGDEYADKRKKLGYDICLACGDMDAQAEAKAKSSRIAVQYNKGPYQYKTPDQNQKDIARHPRAGPAGKAGAGSAEQDRLRS